MANLRSLVEGKTCPSARRRRNFSCAGDRPDERSARFDIAFALTGK
jgi:hypothetical protein